MKIQVMQNFFSNALMVRRKKLFGGGNSREQKKPKKLDESQASVKMSSKHILKLFATAKVLVVSH